MKTEGLQILVVDDNGMNRKMASLLLKKLGCVTEEAASGSECLSMVQEKAYDVIFMDHLMPEMDGIETLKKMKVLENSLNQGTPVVALTANEQEEGEAYYSRYGFDGYLLKPILLNQLEELMRNL